jgi:2'-5' RNA ligase
MRVFVGYPVPARQREALVAWAKEELGDVAGARVVPPEHLTVVRWKERPIPVRTYVPVMEIVPSEIAVYLSVLRAGGAQYDVLDSAALGG